MNRSRPGVNIVDQADPAADLAREDPSEAPADEGAAGEDPAEDATDQGPVVQRPVGDFGPTLTSDVVCLAVGDRVRQLRQGLSMTMATFSEKAGISIGMLSKIEHGQTAPSLATLVRLANAAGVSVTSLFRGLDEEHDIVIIRHGMGAEIIHEGSGPGRIYQDLGSLRGPARVIEPMLTTLTEPDETFPLYQHPGVEFIHMLEGTMEYGYGAGRYTLCAGDTMQIHGEVAHGPTDLVDLPVRFLSIKVYPTPAD